MPFDAELLTSSLRRRLVFAAVMTILLGAGCSGCEHDPIKHDPVAVRVDAGGSELEIAVGSCPAFDVTEVRVVATSKSDVDTVVWDYRPSNGRQRVFQTASSGDGVLLPFRSLAGIEDSTFGAFVFYDQRTAPKGFGGRRALTKPFKLVQTATDGKSYSELLAQRC